MKIFQGHSLAFLTLNALLINFYSEAMYRGFARRMFVPTVVGTSTFCLYSGFKKNRVYAQEDKDNKTEIGSLKNQFDEILPSRYLEFLIEQQKAKIAEEIATIQAIRNKTINVEEKIEEDKEATFFQPRQPQSLCHINEYKNLSVQERISKKFIGELQGQVLDVITYFANHKEFVAKNIKIYNRLLLHGVPGTGKTHLVQVLADELELPLFSFSASFFADKYIGEASRKIRKAFDTVKNLNKPALIFIDEIDAIATERRDGMHEEHRATLTTLLTELQALQGNKNIVVIAATNQFEVLDSAVKDRFSGSVCEIKPLEKANRTKLINKIFLDNGLSSDNDLAERLATVLSSGFSNRDIEYIVTTAKLKKAGACKTDKNACNKHLCSYLRQAITQTGKSASYAWTKSSYCDGI